MNHKANKNRILHKQNRKKMLALCLIFLFILPNTPIFAELDTASYTSQASGLSSQLSALKETLSLCRQRGYSVDYETAYCAMIEKSISYIQEDLYSYANKASLDATVKTDLEGLIPYQIEEVQKLITMTEERLNSYLDGTRAPLDSVKYQSGTVFKNGRELYASVKDSGGNEYVQPVSFVGYGHFLDVVGDFPYFAKTGMNTAQIGIHPYDFLKEPGRPTMWTETYKQDTAAITPESDGENTVIKFTYQGEDTTAAYLSQHFILEPGNTYQIRFRAKSDADNALIVRYGKVEGDWQRVLVKASDDYAEYTGTLTARTGDIRARIWISVDKATNGSYIDDVTLVNTTTGENIVINSGFERTVEYYNDELAVDRDMLAYLLTILEKAESNHIALDMIANVMGLPAHITKKYPDIAGNYHAHLNINLTSAKLREVLGLFYREVAKTIAGHPALKGFCLANEPEYCTWDNPEIFEPLFREYLKNLYNNDISAIRTAHGMQYSSFDSISMPTQRSASPLFYDWKQFNDKIMVDFFGWVYNEVKSVAPNLNCHIKLMANTGYREKEKFVYSGDTAFEALAAYSDFMGCDAYASWEHEAQPMMGKMMMYDLWASVKAAPIVNTEDHVLIDQSINMAPEIAPWIGTDIWLGALHGRSETDLWMWGKSYSPTHHYYGSISSRPDVQEEIVTASMDLVRLAGAVSSFVNSDADVAILYSDSSRVYEKAYLNALYNAYVGVCESGLKVRFVTEKQLKENTVNLDRYKMVIAPLANYLPETVYQKIYEYAQNGGRLLGMGDSCFLYDEYRKERDASGIKGVETVDFTSMPVSGYFVSDEASAKAYVKAQIEDAELKRVRVFDAASDTEVEDTVIQLSETAGNQYLSICNLGYDDKEIYVIIDGIRQNDLFEERTGEWYEETMPLNGYEPVLLSFEKSQVSFSSVGFSGNHFDKHGVGVIRSEEIKKLDTGNIMASYTVVNASQEESYPVQFIVGLYNEAGMADVVVNYAELEPGEVRTLQNVIQVPDVDLTNYCLKVFLWDGEDLLRPVIQAVSLRSYENFDKVEYSRADNHLWIYGKLSGEGVKTLTMTIQNFAGEYVALDELMTKTDGSFSYNIVLNDLSEGDLKLRLRAENTEIYEIGL